MPVRALLRSRPSAVAAALLVVVGLVVVPVALVVRTLSPPACVVGSGDRAVELDARDAERAATAVAAVVRRGGGLEHARRAVAATVPTSSDEARVIAAALTGRTPAALSCRHGGASDAESDRLDARGLTGRAEAVRRDILATCGPVRLGGFAPGGVHNGHMAGSAHYEGRAIDTMFRPVNPRNRRAGWALAQYLVAHAERLSIDTVIFDDRIWTARRASEGWRTYRIDTAGRSRAVARILQHRDHVHVDVAD